ncbi:hypothetical protein DCS_06408 [Drechmeria coniospora]|uniref:Uncharacterized protein n=1 Tax=Drechmeria coniospora TaxID=98403 RepID=A0A151GBG3_DRECN|nr:hypothetical protein DCS_06408 [Drechmeria coniospora]KYK54450.1 hypothetical protein DCS_06408 [Drechmeria coniospora]
MPVQNVEDARERRRRQNRESQQRWSTYNDQPPTPYFCCLTNPVLGQRHKQPKHNGTGEPIELARALDAPLLSPPPSTSDYSWERSAEGKDCWFQTDLVWASPWTLYDPVTQGDRESSWPTGPYCAAPYDSLPTPPLYDRFDDSSELGAATEDTLEYGEPPAFLVDTIAHSLPPAMTTSMPIPPTSMIHTQTQTPHDYIQLPHERRTSTPNEIEQRTERHRTVAKRKVSTISSSEARSGREVGAEPETGAGEAAEKGAEPGAAAADSASLSAENAIAHVQELYHLGVRVGFLSEDANVGQYLEAMKRAYQKIPLLKDTSFTRDYPNK